MMSRLWMRIGFGAMAGLMGGLVSAQESSTLSLDEALRLAQARNGNVAAARLGVRAAQSQTRISRAAFLPSLAPTFRYDTGQSDYVTGGPSFGSSSGKSQNSVLDVTANYVFLDSGQRQSRYRGAQLSARADESDSIETLRQTLFSVHRQYYEVLRNTDLLRVQSAQVQRSETILRQTEARVEVGDAARKDILQARADALNAQASLLTATNGVSTSRAALKSTIGWEADRELPTLVPVTAKPEDPVLGAPTFTLDEAFLRGTRQRADLIAARLRLDASETDVRLARIDGGVTLSLEGSAGRQFSRSTLDRTNLGLFATIPLYDGQRSRQTIAVRELNRDAQRERYIQAERAARAEIETAYKLVVQNVQRYRASQAAFQASQLNYEAALESQRAGAGNLIEVITAQVSLVTAESNLVQASYDTLIAQVQLRLAVGDPIPGENP